MDSRQNHIDDGRRNIVGAPRLGSANHRLSGHSTGAAADRPRAAPSSILRKARSGAQVVGAVRQWRRPQRSRPQAASIDEIHHPAGQRQAGAAHLTDARLPRDPANWWIATALSASATSPSICSGTNNLYSASARVRSAGGGVSAGASLPPARRAALEFRPAPSEPGLGR